MKTAKTFVVSPESYDEVKAALAEAGVTDIHVTKSSDVYEAAYSSLDTSEQAQIAQDVLDEVTSDSTSHLVFEIDKRLNALSEAISLLKKKV